MSTLGDVKAKGVCGFENLPRHGSQLIELTLHIRSCLSCTQNLPAAAFWGQDSGYIYNDITVYTRFCKVIFNFISCLFIDIYNSNFDVSQEGLSGTFSISCGTQSFRKPKLFFSNFRTILQENSGLTF